MKKKLIPLKDILEELFKKNPVFSDIYFLHCLKKSWFSLAGEEITKVSYPLRFKNKELTIALPSSSHLQEMHFIKETLRRKINHSFPHMKVGKILLQVKTSAKPYTDPV